MKMYNKKAIKQNVFRSLLKLYPFMYGQDRIMSILNMPVPSQEVNECKIKNFPLNIQHDPRTYLGRQLYYFGYYEPGICDFVRRRLRPGETFLDIGANYGLYSIISSYVVGCEGRVIAFEPQE